MKATNRSYEKRSSKKKSQGKKRRGNDITRDSHARNVYSAHRALQIILYTFAQLN